MMFRQLTVIGVGLIGGSVARALREANACEKIVGCGRNPVHLQQAVDLGVIDSYEHDIAAAVTAADLVLVAVPLAAMPAVFAAMRAHLTADVIVTDVGSAKLAAIESARKGLADRVSVFVPGHPIAGTEKSGVAASFAGLFARRRVILTPLAENTATIIASVRHLWTLCGAEVIEMDAAHHDTVLAATSHLPHLLAYSLVDLLLQMDDSEEIFDYAASGFRDFTRIASSDPVMWRDICLANGDAIVALLEQYRDKIDHLREAIQRADGEQIETMFTRAKSVRDRITESNG